MNSGNRHNKGELIIHEKKRFGLMIYNDHIDYLNNFIRCSQCNIVKLTRQLHVQIPKHTHTTTCAP